MRDTALARFATAGMLSWRDTQPGRQLATILEHIGIAHGRHHGITGQCADPDNTADAPTAFIGFGVLLNAFIGSSDTGLPRVPMRIELAEQFVLLKR